MQSDQSESQQTNTGEASSQESTPAQGDLGATGARPEAESERSDRADDGAVTGAQAELEATKDRYLRLAAEFDNFRKRTDRERIESRDRAQGELLEQILDSLDDLQRVAELDAEKTTVDALLEGIRMVERKLLKALEGAGLELLDARGQPFDPEVHDALFTAPADSPEEDDTVGDVLQAGYRFRGMLLRPARVQVKKHGG